MHPVLFKIPLTELTVKSYGLMMVIGFLSAVWLIRHLSRDITPNPQMITNAALYSLIAGVAGARIFYVLHYLEKFKGDYLSAFAIWNGGFELLGGVILAIIVIFAYLCYHKLPIRQYLDILAISLFLALALGRIGCFLSGCCFGKPANLPWAVRFPYSSDAYRSQVEPDPKRNRAEPYFKLPSDFFGYIDKNGFIYPGLKPDWALSKEQKQQVDNGNYACLPVHPTELYSSAAAGTGSFILYLFWRRSRKTQREKLHKLFTAPGSTFALLFILYSIGRFLVEFLRDDNPFEYSWWAIYKGGTISQNFCIYLFIFGWVLMIIFQKYQQRAANQKNNRGG
jgi:phosphatidylglycerol:prolipoprotein diacylglycerol transferase